MNLSRTAILLSALLAATTCTALTVDVTTVDGFTSNTSVKDSAGTAIAAGNRIMVGTFDTSSAATPAAFFEANKSNLATLMSHFTSVSSHVTLVGTSDRDWVFGLTYKASGSTAASAGCFTLSVGPSVAGTALENKKVYLVVFKTSDNTTNLGPNYWNVSEIGVFSSSNTEWVFKSDASDPSVKITLRTNQVDQYYVSNGSALKTMAVGSTHPGALWAAENGNALSKTGSWYGDVWPVQYGNGWFVSSQNAAWQYAVAGSDGVWIYDSLLGWTWTKELFYPYLYLYDLGQWVYFYGINSGARYYCVFDSSLAPSLPQFPYATDVQLSQISLGFF